MWVSKTHKQNAHVQFSYTQRSLKHPLHRYCSPRGYSYLNHEPCRMSYTQHTSKECKSNEYTLIGDFQLLWKSSYTNTHSHTIQHTHRYMQCPSWSQRHTFTHRHTCTTVEISGLLLSYNSAMSSDTFHFFLLPESSLSPQKTQHPKKKSKPWWPEVCSNLYRLSCLFSSLKTTG